MKKIKNQKTTTQVAIFAGAAALMALPPQTRAQTSVDALLNKLEQKGILSVDEARELKAENATNSVSDFNKAFGSKLPMPDWVTGYKLTGDFRGRFDDVSVNTPAFKDNQGNFVDNNNIRLRYRVRAGLIVNMKDDLQVGFRLGSADAGSNGLGGNPVSNNTTSQGNGSKKFLYVDAAYGKWTPINDGTWMLTTTIGKMDEPFQQSAMVFDPDYTPEGAALQANYKINERNSLAFNGAAFVLDQLNSRGPFLYGGQVIWNAHWTPRIGTSLGVAAYDIGDTTSLKHNYDSNMGNTPVAGGFLTGPGPTTGGYANDFNPIVASGSVTYTLDSFPLYPGAFPVTLAGEYLDNPGASSNNKGWWGGVTLGKSGKKHAWDISYRFQRLEADAWWDQIVDDDNAAFFPIANNTFGNITGPAAIGGTDIQGHLIKFDYSIFDSLTFTFTAYINDLINNPVPAKKSDALHAMADLMWKF